MRGTTTGREIDLIIENIGGNSGNSPPAGGKGGDDNGKCRRKGQPSPGRYYTGVAIGIVSILMFFMALASAFLVRRGSIDWIPVHIPSLLWFNTAVLLASSGTLELARKRLASGDARGFRNFWLLTTALGIAFLVGQVAAWRILVGQNVYLSSNPASSFFYVFTGAHAVHLLAGVGALLYVSFRNFDLAKVTRTVAADVTSYFWHFL